MPCLCLYLCVHAIQGSCREVMGLTSSRGFGVAEMAHLGCVGAMTGSAWFPIKLANRKYRWHFVRYFELLLVWN
jgi:hypothetical protein